ncbi:LOW QUALITY PROTEIN: lysozyme g-like [Cariama cristata]
MPFSPSTLNPGWLERYGNILSVDTTGASEATVKPEGLSYAGVPASEKMAEKDLKNMEKYQAKITKAGNRKCVDPAVTAGIVFESHAGTVLKDGWGDHRNAFGLIGVSGVLILLSHFQADKQYHKIARSWDSEEHSAQGTEVLCGLIKEVQKICLCVSFTLISGGITAYNAGANDVQSYDTKDIGTTHNDYANDVVARAKFYKGNG